VKSRRHTVFGKKFEEQFHQNSASNFENEICLIISHFAKCHFRKKFPILFSRKSWAKMLMKSTPVGKTL